MTGERRRRGRLSFAALLAVLVLSGPGVARAEPPAGEVPAAKPLRAEQGLFKVLSPRSDSFPQGGQLRVRLAVDPGVSLRSVTLNGVQVKRFFSVTGSGGRVVATLREDALGGLLKPGRNTLRFIVRRGGPDGTRDFDAVSFTRVKNARSLVRKFRLKHPPGRPVRVALGLSKLHAKVRVLLNNRNISRRFKRGGALERLVLLGANDGVKHGTNRLRIRVTHHHGDIRRLHSTFGVPNGVTIAGAGRDRSAQTGVPIRLNGKSSQKALRKSGKRKPGKLRYRWSIVSKPRGSTPRLFGRSKARPTMQTDLPGSYRLKLTTTQAPPANSRAAQAGGAAGPAASTDFTTTTSEPQPFVQFNAFASAGGESGFAVEQTRDCTESSEAQSLNCFLPNAGAEGELQVVTLDRVTLEPTPIKAGTTTYPANAHYDTAALATFAAQMEALVKNPGAACPTFNQIQLPDDGPVHDYLILIALREGTIEDTANWGAATKWFNLDPPANQSSSCATPQPQAVPQGAFSEIVVPGMLEGKAWMNNGLTIDSDPTGKPGNLYGYLAQTVPVKTTDPPSTYSFNFQDALAYNTRATQAPDGTPLAQASFQLGDQTLAISPGNADGFAIFNFDPVNPAGTLQREFVGNSQGPGTGIAWNMMQSVLRDQINAGRGVAIVSNGQIGGFTTEPEIDQFDDVLQRIETLGGVGDTFARAVNDPQGDGTYSMLSSNGVAYQSSSAYADALPANSNPPPSDLPVNNGRLTGTILRAGDGKLVPHTGDPSGQDLQTDFTQTVQRSQVDWLLTPGVDASGATCQELAFAFVIATIKPSLVPAGADSLWSDTGEGTTKCASATHPTTAATHAADTLDGDGCATDDPDAPGANAANVRTASLNLRAQYQNINFATPTVSDQAVGDPPADAPFTEADINCAVNQMNDEFDAFNQTTSTMTDLQNLMLDAQVEELGQLPEVAQSIENGEEKTLATEIAEPPGGSSASFWGGMGPAIFSNVADIGVFMAGDAAGPAASFTIMALVGETGGNVFAGIEGAGAGNPVGQVGEYLLLQSQLALSEDTIEDQINDSMTAQKNGVAQTARLLYADPAKMTILDTGSSSQWALTTAGMANVQDAYVYRVTQMAYQASFPQVYEGVRFNFDQGCMHVQGGNESDVHCFEDGAWSDMGRGLVPGTQAADIVLCHFPDSNGAPFEGADASTTPFGLGQGNEYHPQISPATTGSEGVAANYMVYVMAESDEVNPNHLKSHRASVADANSVAPFFAQPQEPGDTSAGFYGPDFWHENLELDHRVSCGDSDNNRYPLSTPGGIFEDIQSPTDRWPTELNP